MLIDALWVYQTAYKTTLSMSLYRVVFEKPFHLPVEIEHHALWAIKQLNFYLNKADDLWKLQISKLEEIQNEAYDNARISKSRTKIFNDRFIHRKIFVPRQKVLLYNSRLHLFAGKLKTRWLGPFTIQTVFSHGAVKISDLKNDKIFKVNGQRLKPFLVIDLESNVDKVMGLYDPFHSWPKIALWYFSPSLYIDASFRGENKKN